MKILFLGDSYSSNDSGWPSQVAQALSATAINHSLAGSSLNYMFTKLDSELNDKFYDIVIVTITSGDRLFHSDKLIVPGSSRYNDGTPIVGKERKAIDFFYTHVWDLRNGNITGQLFQLAMSTFSLVYPKTKFVFLPAFSDWENHSIGNYVYTYPRLLYASQLDTKSQKMEQEGLITNRLNHLSENQNTDLADQMVAMINQYNFNSATACELNLSRL